jgi:hypothetical protein
MTVLLDARSDNFGKIYKTEGPKSSNDLEKRRRRFSMATQLFDHGETDTQNQIQPPQLIDPDKPLVEEPAPLLNGEPIHKSESMPCEPNAPIAQPAGKFDRRYSLGNPTSNEKALEDFKGRKLESKSLSRKSSSAMGKFVKFLKFVWKDQFNNLNSLESLDKEAEKLAELGSGNQKSPNSENIASVPSSMVQNVINYQNKAGDMMLESSEDSRNEQAPRQRERKGSVCSATSTSAETDTDDDRQRAKSNSVPPVGANARNLYMVDEKGKIVSLEAQDSPRKGILKAKTCPPSLEDNVTALKEKRKSRTRTLSKVGRSKKYINGKQFRFNEFVVIFETYCDEEYDRRMGVDLEQNMLNTLDIKRELNDFKRNEMSVHEESEKFTHYLVI